MLKNARSVCVACSGGPDSTVLLHFFADYAQSHKIKLSVAHVNHQLRGRDSGRDEKFVKNLATSLQIPFYAAKVDVRREAKLKRLSIEEAARDLRYAYLVKLAKEKKFDAVLLAHTMDDQAETVLMRFLSGSGIQGLGGSRPVFFRNKIKFARPFIDIEKAAILKFLKKHRFTFRKDKSNESVQFVRNRIRLELIPFLEKKFSPGIKKVLARLPQTLAADIDFLNSESERQFKKLGKLSRNDVSFAKLKFAKLPEAIQFRLLQLAVRHLGELEFESKHWFAFKALFSEKSMFATSFPGNLLCSVSENRILLRYSNRPLTLKKKSGEDGFRYSLKLGGRINIAESGMTIEATKLSKRPKHLKKRREDFVIMDAGSVQFPLQIRSRRPGDLFQPLGQSQPSKLKDFLIRRKIPHGLRDRLPLVFSKNRMDWIPGIAMSESVKVTPQTTSFLKLSVNPSLKSS